MSGTDGATATAAGTATDPAATATTTTAGTTTDTGTATAGAGAQTQAQPTLAQLQADVDKWKALSRTNEAKAKANRDADDAQKKLLAEVAQKLGIATGDGKIDPAQITAQLETAQREASSRSRELAVLRAAGRLGADGDALLDSRAFAAILDGLDPAQPEGIEAAIKAALAGSPGKYAATTTTQAASTAADGTGAAAASTTAAASSAGDFTSSSSGSRQWTQADVDRATPAQVTDALSNGLLSSLLAS